MNEIFFSVDIETSGPVPALYSMLSIGACLVHEPHKTFYAELRPDSKHYDPEALRVTGFDLDQLAVTGLAPETAMLQFSQWIQSLIPAGKKGVFVGLNAPFDWSFINYYFHKYAGSNPLGFSALDIKAYYMGLSGCTWAETKSSNMSLQLSAHGEPSHNALDDAIFQAELFGLMLKNCHA